MADTKPQLLRVKVVPNAKFNEIVGWKTDVLVGRVLQVRIKAPPVDGKANKELRVFLAKHYGVSKAQVIVVKGSSARIKTVSLPAHVVNL